MIRGLLIKPDHQPEVIEFDNNYKELQRLVDFMTYYTTNQTQLISTLKQHIVLRYTL